MPRAMATKPLNSKMTTTYVAVACMKDVVIVKDGRIVSSINVGYEPASVAIHPAGNELAVGGSSVNLFILVSLAWSIDWLIDWLLICIWLSDLFTFRMVIAG